MAALERSLRRSRAVDPFAVNCPRCNEPAPQLCRDPAGNVVGHPHPERTKAARQTTTAAHGQ